MLYINVYIEHRTYGGPEEGGWYYGVGEPVASIPIESVRAKGQTFHVCGPVCGPGKRELKIVTCDYCDGEGWTEETDENNGETYRAVCKDCGEVPANVDEVMMLADKAGDMFEGEVGRYDTLIVRFENHFATFYPEERPRYE